MAERNAGEICHTCGGTSNLDLVVICDKCKEISTHVYCINIMPHEIPEQWYCEECIDHEQTSNDPKGNSNLDKPSLKRVQFESVPPTKARAPLQTGKVKFISEREITLLNDRKYFAKRSSAQEKVPKKRRMMDILGLPHHNKKKEAMTRDKVKEASEKNRELKPEKEKLTNLPVSGVVWKGVINYFEHVSHTHNVQVHLAEKASQKVEEISKEMPQKISLKVKPILEFWPEAFKLQCPSHEDIGLYMFSSESDRPKEKFHRMVERLYKSDQVLVGRIGILGLCLFPSQILPKYNQCYVGTTQAVSHLVGVSLRSASCLSGECNLHFVYTGIDGECYLWGILQRYKRKVSNQAPVTFCITTSAKKEVHNRASGYSQVKSNETQIDVDMEIDMIGGVELSTTFTAKLASQPDPIKPPGFHTSHLKSNNPRNHNCLESDMARLMTSPGSQLSCSELHSVVEAPAPTMLCYHLRV